MFTHVILPIKEENISTCGASGRLIKSLVRDVFPMSEVAVSFQGVWPGDAKEKHRYSGRWFPSNTHHRVKSAFLHFSGTYQRDAGHSESNADRQERMLVLLLMGKTLDVSPHSN